MTELSNFDYILVGGGLHNGLLALSLHHHQPACKVLLIEEQNTLGGNKTWCFHQEDIDDASRPFVEPLIAYEWPAYDVAFPGLRRTVRSKYFGLTSSDLDRCVRESFAQARASRLLTNARAVEVTENNVTLEDGRTFDSRAVLSTHHSEAHRKSLVETAFQKFIGLEISLTTPHGLAHPILMDAEVPQSDGYRFFYILPFDDRRLLVEDTYFSLNPGLDRASLREGLHRYIENRGWNVEAVLREEQGVLPLPLRFEPRAATDSPPWGFGDGWFHPATGYSFPVALHLAREIGRISPCRAYERLRLLKRAWHPQFSFGLLLNRLLFRWFEPEVRIGVFERFYRRYNEGLIHRFYAMKLTKIDRLKILTGSPPRGFSLRTRLRYRAGKISS